MKLEQITAGYDGRNLFKNFSLELPDRGIICLFAPSGSGKTTLLRLLAGLIAPTAGKITGLEGKKIAAVFQEDRLVPSMTIRQNVELVLDKGQKKTAQEYLDKVGLSDWKDAFPEELSGGMLRRASLARAFAYAKQHRGAVFFLLDEPLKGLDEQATKEMLKLIREETSGSLAFFVTHDRAQAQEISDRILCLQGQPLRLTEG